MKKFLKYLAFFLAGLIAVTLIAALFAKKDYAVERSVTILKSNKEVYDYVKYLKNQDNFSVWAKIDPGMEKQYRGTDGEVGFVSAWSSDVKEAGSGEQEITAIKEGERIDYVIRFYEPMQSTDNAFMTFNAQNDSVTNLVWGFYGRIKYPMNLMLVFMDMDEMLGKDLQGGLDNLKSLLEE
jgi:uncharacterized protein YndB with AHSA1/START domain